MGDLLPKVRVNMGDLFPKVRVNMGDPLPKVRVNLDRFWLIAYLVAEMHKTRKEYHGFTGVASLVSE